MGWILRLRYTETNAARDCLAKKICRSDLRSSTTNVRSLGADHLTDQETHQRSILQPRHLTAPGAQMRVSRRPRSNEALLADGSCNAL